MPIELLRSLLWTNYRLGILFAGLIPLGLLMWTLRQQARPLTHLLVIYGRVASLLAIAGYMMMAEIPQSFFASFGALILIPISLWFWVDLNEEIEDRRGQLKSSFSAWRWAMTLYCVIGALTHIPFLKCGFSQEAIAAPMCQAWLEAPWAFKAIFHSNTETGKLRFIAVIALIVYVLYLVYFLFFRLTKQGRSATGF